MAITASKIVGYAVVRAGPNLAVSKIVGYAVVKPGPNLAVAKVVGYAVVTQLRIDGVIPQPINASGQGITIYGSGFLATPTVSIDGSAATSVVLVSGSVITCTTPALTPGIHVLTVTNGDGKTININVYVGTRVTITALFS